MTVTSFGVNVLKTKTNKNKQTNKKTQMKVGGVLNCNTFSILMALNSLC